MYLVLDQAEEYFLYHADDSGPGSFAEALPALLSAPYRVNVLVSLREDSLAKLDRFTGRIPGLFANTLRLDRLDRRAAHAAIVRPVERFAELTGEGVAVAPGLVERVLDDVGAGQIEPALGGLGSVESGEGVARIEAPYLQLVMQRLWDEERALGSDVLRVETLERLGGAQHIVEEHLEGAMAELTTDEKDIAARLFNHLVTPSGTKIAHEVSDLADFGVVSLDELRPVLATLGERRILRSLEEGGDVRYEIFHDVLAQPVLVWRARHRTEREIERKLAESHRRRRRLQLLFALVLVALGLMTGVSVFALSQRSEAREQAREAKAHELEALARGEFDTDPELGLLLAREAAVLSPTPSSEETLREALRTSRVRSIVQLGDPVLGASVRRGDVRSVTARGSVSTADATTGRVLEKVETSSGVFAASFDRGGGALLTSSDGLLRSVRADGSVVEVPGVSRVRGAELSADGKLAVVFDENGARLVEVDSGSVRQSFDRLGTLAVAISRDRSLVATGHAAKAVRVWDTRTGARLLKLFGHVGRIAAVAFSPRGDLVASASTDGMARVWRTNDGQLVAVLTGHGNFLTDVEFSPDGTQVATASRDRTARVWKVDTGALLTVLRGHRDVVVSAEFAETGRSVVTAGADGTARVWDAVVQPELVVLTRLSAPVTDLAFTDGRLRAMTKDRRVHVLNPRTGEKVSSEAAGPRASAIVGPDGAKATIRGESVVVRTPRGRRVLEGHGDRVTSASFSPDGTLLVTSSRDREARIWDVATGDFGRAAGSLRPSPGRSLQPGRSLGRHRRARASGTLGRTNWRAGHSAPRAQGNPDLCQLRPNRANDRDGRRRRHGPHLSVRDLQRHRRAGEARRSPTRRHRPQAQR